MADTTATRGEAVSAPADTIYALPNVTVIATRIQVEPADAPVRVSVLDRTAIEQTAARTVADVLDERAGVFVRQYGAGQLATLSMRGSGASQTLLLLDGHRVSDPQLGQVDLALLPASLFESVEVMHGAASPLYGSDGMGGAVNLRTRRPGAASAVTLSGSAGAFGERQGTAMLSGRYESVQGSALFTYQMADGDFPYVDETSFPPESVRRTNADREQAVLYVTGTHTGERQQTRLSGWYSTAERGLPGTATASSSDERQWDAQLRLWADHERQLSDGTLTVGGAVQQSRLRYVDPDLDLDERGRTLTSTLTTELRRPLRGRWFLAGGVEGRYAQARHPNLEANAREGRASTFVSGTGQYGTLTFYPAARVDAYMPVEGAATVAVNPRLGVNVQPMGSASRWHVKVNAGRSFRQPTMNDRFWQPGGRPDLRPERGWSFDAGMLLDADPAVQVEGTLFAHLTRDEIVWNPTEGYWAPDNVRRTRTLGGEASARHRATVAERVQVTSGLTYTYTDARNRSDPDASTFNQPLRHVPRHQLKGHVSTTLGAWTLDLGGRYVGRRYMTGDGTQTIEPHLVVDAQARLAQEIGGVDFQLALAVDNLLDADYAVLPNRPMPPRHARLQLTIDIEGDS